MIRWLRTLWRKWTQKRFIDALLPVATATTGTPFMLVGRLDGVKVERGEVSGAKARIVYESLTERQPVGTLEFRHNGAVRSRYECLPDVN